MKGILLRAALPAFVAALVFLGFDIYFHVERIMYSISPGYYATVGFFSTFALFLALLLASWGARSHLFRVVLYCGALLLQVMMLIYYILQGSFIDYALLRTNFGEIMTASGVRTIFMTSGVAVWILCLAGLVGAIAVMHRGRWLRAGDRGRAYGLTLGAAALAVILFFAAYPFNPSPIYNFAWGIRRFNQDLQPAFLSFEDKEPYPYVRDFKPSRPWPKGQKRPHVIFLLVESFSGLYVDAKTDEGREITPTFNRLYREETAFRRFYSPSVQTERAHFATLCSILPSFRKKVMTHHAGNAFRCLPEVLRDNGYYTLGMRADSDEEFDNEVPFLRGIGFDEARAMVPEDLTVEEKANVWAWGLQDDHFYRKAFRRLDAITAEDPARPVFAFLATVSNHTPFNEMPDALKTLYSHPPRDPRETYLTSLHMSDAFLATFFAELDRRPEFKDAIVFVMGDHGFGTGQHGVYVNTRTYYDELFRVPLVVRWPGRLAPGLRANEGYSQVDLAPTVLDWLGLAATTHFTGTPIPRAPGKGPALVHLFQPYDGVYLASLAYPWKYVYSLSDGKQFLHNLADDPLELIDRMEPADSRAAAPMDLLRSGVRDIFRNQKLIQEDRIYPRRGLRRPTGPLIGDGKRVGREPVSANSSPWRTELDPSHPITPLRGGPMNSEARAARGGKK